MHYNSTAAVIATVLAAVLAVVAHITAWWEEKSRWAANADQLVCMVGARRSFCIS